MSQLNKAVNKTVNKTARADPFAAFMKLKGKPCLMIGGQGEAADKIQVLLRAGAEVTLVAETMSSEMSQVLKEHPVNWQQVPFAPHHLDGVWLVVSTLTDVVQNRTLFELASERQIWLNVVDQPKNCTIIWPALVHRSPITVAISTGGASPALAGYLRALIENLIPPSMGELAYWLSGWRRRVGPKLPDLAARGQFWRVLFEKGLPDCFLNGDVKNAEKMIRKQADIWSVKLDDS
ncbi:MAG: bifunctional precorrin-2 dehydrogenase/sirohydrochlorin ferrochelatase [Magnetococcales bacterium]|nr:bifunctional precorrin-2 dehydrogenase/sirohydrochlorin ferrochelatase [Magnetococcales bacterium]